MDRFFHKSGQKEDPSQRGRKHISDPQRVPNFTTAAESLRQFWFRLFPFSPRNGSCGHFQRLQCCESWAADVCVDCNLGTAGKITSTASLNNTPQRQVQFAVRLEF